MKTKKWINKSTILLFSFSEQLSAERDWDRERIELLTEENARLEFEKKTSMNESASLEQELDVARAKVGSKFINSIKCYWHKNCLL